APVEVVYGYLADMEQHHPKFLPRAFSDFRVESGGVGAGTVTTFTLTAGGRRRPYRMEVAEPVPGRVLTESDTRSSLVTTFTVEPVGRVGPMEPAGAGIGTAAGKDGADDASTAPAEGAGSCRVRIATRWEAAAGVGGFFERLFAPATLRRLYDEELTLLDAYARRQAGASAGGSGSP
ncbi:MAG: hypothetical protein ACRDY3_05635, partial [Acidimicrobiales bacterium]